jgi:hypothetical protein
MIRMLRAIAEKLGVEVTNDFHLEALSEKTKPEKLAKQIERRDEVKVGGE